jgi:hypothetical protein
MSSAWRAEQEIQAALRGAGVISQRQRQAQEAALKRERDRIQREKYAEHKARRYAETIALTEEKRLEMENAAQEKARKEAEAAVAILEVKLQEEDAKEIKRKKEEGWDDTELRHLQQLQLLARILEDPTSITAAEPTYPTPWGEWKWDGTWTNNNEYRSREMCMLCYIFMISTLRLQTHFFCRVFRI